MHFACAAFFVSSEINESQVLSFAFFDEHHSHRGVRTIADRQLLTDNC